MHRPIATYINVYQAYTKPINRACSAFLTFLRGDPDGARLQYTLMCDCCFSYLLEQLHVKCYQDRPGASVMNTCTSTMLFIVDRMVP